MALHRDIFWIGRQWAVTGFGMQAINQKHDGQFDIPIERLWDDGLIEGVSGQKWFNPDDFAKGLVIAQARHPKPPESAKPPARVPVETTHASTATAVSEPLPLPIVSAVVEPVIAATETAPESAEPSNPAPSFPEMRVLDHPARLSRVWHARRRK